MRRPKGETRAVGSRKTDHVRRIGWDELNEATRSLVEARTGPVISAASVSEGMNSELAAVLQAQDGAVFLKGLRLSHPGMVAQRREAAVNPFVCSISPRLLWEVESAKWHILGFQYRRGRTADFSPGSSDLRSVTALIADLGELPCPDLPFLKIAERRWADYLDHPSDAQLLRGETLLHTDYNPSNLLIAGSGARLVDWAWPTRGAPWVDPACLVVRLVAAGHSPEGAEEVAAAIPAWHRAPPGALDVCAIVLSRMWADIAEAGNSGWKSLMAVSALTWHRYRGI